MANVWVVRANVGRYTRYFVSGGYIAIGWIPEGDLSAVDSREELYRIYKSVYPDDSNIVVGQQVGQIARFLLEMSAGDYVITPRADTEWLRFGRISPDPPYYDSNGGDGCPFPHRRQVEWDGRQLRRSEFSVPFQNTIRSSLTVFSVERREEFLGKIGASNAKAYRRRGTTDPHRVVLDQILELDASEFEFLVGHLLTALGFESTEVTRKTRDGGVDVIGEMNVSNLARVKVFVQAKRYKVGAKVSTSTVRSLRQAIPFGGQGAFITTASFPKRAFEVALAQDFPRIGLINGAQLVDLLVEHWDDIPEEFREKLGLKPGLVRV